MTFPLNYFDAMVHVANFALDTDNAGYVRGQMLRTLVQELSPLNERHAEVERALGLDQDPSTWSCNHGRIEREAYLLGARAAAAILDEFEAFEESDKSNDPDYQADEDEDASGQAEEEPP